MAICYLSVSRRTADVAFFVVVVVIEDWAAGLLAVDGSTIPRAAATSFPSTDTAAEEEDEAWPS